MRAAVLDLGTNTFQILIADLLQYDFITVHRDERWVNLMENGADKIGSGALERMREVLTVYRIVIDKYRPEKIIANGTAMFRKASNSGDARALVERIIDTTPQVISGDEEARLIYKGVRLAALGVEEKMLVIDIGGGSTEFIIGERDYVLWKKSYTLGATLLRQKFHNTEPITADERNAIKNYALDMTLDLQLAMQQHQPKLLVGASGSFDSFASMLQPDTAQETLQPIDADALLSLFQKLFTLNESQRKNLPGLVWYRVLPIVTAAVLTQTIVERFGFEKIYRSAYAVKEGVMLELVVAK